MVASKFRAFSFLIYEANFLEGRLFLLFSLGSLALAQTGCKIWFLLSKHTYNEYNPTCICGPACRVIEATGYCCEVSVTEGRGVQAPCYYGSKIGIGECDHRYPFSLIDYEAFQIATEGDGCHNSQGDICWNS
jgi:hypothetical protein